MRTYLLALGLLAVMTFSLATTLEPWFQKWEGNRARSANVLQVALGDSRRLFAKHIFVKADVYFHNGYYPTIYDSKEGYDKAHISADMRKEGEENEEAENFLGKPRDWIDRFSRHFFPARHTHLGDSGCGHSCCQRAKDGHGHDENCEHKDHDPEVAGGQEREILPWLRLSAELDPQRIETYVVGSYWLRKALNKADEAERFLREGLQHNPGDPELLFELGRIYHEKGTEAERARTLWELAVKNWREREASKPDPNVFLYGQLLGNLAMLEWAHGNFASSGQWYRELLVVSPNKESIRKWIEECDAKVAGRLPPNPVSPH
jgi:tetratricopeptide (TPR) repeat protein